MTSAAAADLNYDFDLTLGAEFLVKYCVRISLL